MASNPVSKLTVEQYLALDRAAERKSEFLDGEMFAMSGVSFRHDQIQMNFIVGLAPALRGRNCRIFSGEVRVRVSASMYAYPDLSIVCGKVESGDQNQDILLNPIILFEILSPSTANYDRGLKFQRYRTIQSLREYILVDQNQVQIEQYTRQADNKWIFRDYQRLDEDLQMPSIDVSLPLQRIYDGVEFSSTLA